MPTRTDIAEIQKLVSNIIDPSLIGDKKIAGVLGEAPSRYSKSPAIWKAAFGVFGINAIYLSFDVDDSRLRDLVSALRASKRFKGANVTVPHKVRIMEFLDELDPGARRIGAVNTVVRTPAGRLIGYNTDGEGFVESILTRQPGERESFMKSLKGVDVLLIGAGGSARAVAFHLADLLDGGRLIICNRTVASAETLAKEIRSASRRTKAVTEEEIPRWAPTVGLIINSTTKGQFGLRRLPDGGVTNLEPYSALAGANPPAFGESDFKQRWIEAAQADIDANNQASMNLAQSIPQTVRFYDLIYYPQETVFLRHGRETGHMTMNGKGMIVCQAAIAFARYICKTELQQSGKDGPESYRKLLEVMHGAW